VCEVSLELNVLTSFGNPCTFPPFLYIERWLTQIRHQSYSLDVCAFVQFLLEISRLLELGFKLAMFISKYSRTEQNAEDRFLGGKRRLKKHAKLQWTLFSFFLSLYTKTITTNLNTYMYTKYIHKYRWCHCLTLKYLYSIKNKSAFIFRTRSFISESYFIFGQKFKSVSSQNYINKVVTRLQRRVYIYYHNNDNSILQEISRRTSQ